MKYFYFLAWGWLALTLCSFINTQTYSYQKQEHGPGWESSYYPAEEPSYPQDSPGEESPPQQQSSGNDFLNGVEDETAGWLKYDLEWWMPGSHLPQLPQNQSEGADIAEGLAGDFAADALLNSF